MLNKILIITCIFTIVGGSILYATSTTKEAEDTLVIEVEEEATTVETLDYIDTERVEPYKDDLDLLFEKFDVPYEYRDYTRQICELQNVDPIIFTSLVQIESHWGTSITGVASDYNKKVAYRMYGKNKQWTDLGLGQLSTRWLEEFETRHFNPSLIRSLGYVRENFRVADPWINLQVSASYLSYLYKYFGNYEEAVQAYNTGMGNVRRGTIPKITYKYSNAILNSWKYREKDV